MKGWSIVLGIFAGLLGSASQVLAQNEYHEPPSTHTLGGSGPHASYWTWRSSPPDGSAVDVTYFIGTGVFGLSFTPEMQARIRDAAATWSSAGAAVNLVEVPSAAGADIVITPRWILPTATTVDAIPNHGSPNYLDGTTWHQITGSDVYLNIILPNWYTGADPSLIGPGQLDFQSYVLHQLGYALGLGDAIASDGPGSVMLLPPGAGTTRRNPTPDDRAALGQLYGFGVPEPATAVLFGMGLVAVGAVRKSRRRSVHAV